MPAARRPYIIYAFPYDETSGGVIAVHLLCQRLAERGETALVWPATRPASLVPRDRASLAKLFWYLAAKLRRRRFATGPFRHRLASPADLRDAIVVYPEVINGNPLGARRVVRWFLHRPGFHLGTVDYGENELYFFYQDAFDDPAINPHPAHRLTLTFFNPAYRRTNFGAREGSCYLLRKGRDRASGIDFGDQPCVDDLSHEEMAAAFNRYRYLHSFDTYSMYSVFAAMCGCIPVIEPMPGVSREEWFPDPVDRYGLAYGWDDVGWAAETQGALLDQLAGVRAEQDAMLARFVAVTQARFGATPTP